MNFSGNDRDFVDSRASAEFFISSLQEKINSYEAKRDILKGSIEPKQNEIKNLKVQLSKLQGLLLSQ